MAACLEDLIAGPFPLENWHDGDVIITNDPYSGGQHLPDIQTFKPVFLDGQLIAIAGILVHHLDVGGGAPGSYDAGASEIHQEGLRIPPLKIVEGGRRNQAIIDMLLANSREPANVGGDFARSWPPLAPAPRPCSGLAGAMARRVWPPPPAAFRTSRKRPCER